MTKMKFADANVRVRFARTVILDMWLRVEEGQDAGELALEVDKIVEVNPKIECKHPNALVAVVDVVDEDTIWDLEGLDEDSEDDEIPYGLSFPYTS